MLVQRILLSLLVYMSLNASASGQKPVSLEQAKQWNIDCVDARKATHYAASLTACLKAVEAMERLAPDQLPLATALNSLAELYFAQGEYPKIEPLLLRSLKIREQALGKDHLDVVEILNNLAVLYNTQEDYAKAEQLHLRSLKIREKELGPEDLQVALSLNHLGETYYDQGAYAKVEPLLMRSLKIREKASGPDSVDVAETINDLALLYQTLGQYDIAEKYILRSLRIIEKVRGPDHPYVSSSLNNLAGLYCTQKEYAKAEPLLWRSLRIREMALGKDHPELAAPLHTLAMLYRDQGEYTKAEPLLLRTLQILEKSLGSENTGVAASLNTLGSLYKDQGKYKEAESQYLRSRQIMEKALGATHPKVAALHNNLALLYQLQGEYAKAESLYLRSRPILEKALGVNHPKFASYLNNLAYLYQEQGNYAKADALHLRSLQIKEQAFGEDYPEIVSSLANLALSALAQGRPTRALPLIIRELAIREQSLRTAATESRCTALLDVLRGNEDQTYSLLQIQEIAAQALPIALTTSLLRKGRAAEVGLMTGRALLHSLTSEDQRQRFQQYQALRVQRDTLYQRGPGKQALAEHRARLTELQDQIDVQEQQLARAAPELSAWKLPPPEQILAHVAAKLPKDGVLVEILWTYPRHFKAKWTEPKWGSPHYLALLLFPDGGMDFVDLGLAESVDQAEGTFLMAVRNNRSDPVPSAHALYLKIFAPLVPKLRGAQKIYLSPDGSLNLVPFAALHDGQRYLLDSPYQFRYLTSGRDLIRGSLGQSAQPPLVVAYPAYDRPLVAANTAHTRTQNVQTRQLYQGVTNLSPLPGTRQEGTFVGSLLGVRPLMGAMATEEALRQARAPSVLHIATHGLFFDQPGMGQGRSPLLKPSIPMPAASMDQMLGRSQDYSLSRSALLLAGAAHASDAADATNDGLLTGEEARSLNLFGTQLVVLSACDTGVGSVKAGQGVYGFRRAFFVAGAETVVMSLWPISDLGTQSLMGRYYQLLLDKRNPRSRISGLEEAMKEVMAKNPHPYYWAPFIGIGRDAPLVISVKPMVM